MATAIRTLVEEPEFTHSQLLQEEQAAWEGYDETAARFSLRLARGQDAADVMVCLSNSLSSNPRFCELAADLAKDFGIEIDYDYKGMAKFEAAGGDPWSIPTNECQRGMDLRFFVAKVFLAGIYHERITKGSDDFSLNL